MREARLRDRPSRYEGTDAMASIEAGTARRRTEDSLKQDFALGVKEFDGQAGGPALDDDFIVEGVRKVVKSTQGGDASHVRQLVDEVVQHARNAVGLSGTEGVVHASDFGVFGFHAKHDLLGIGDQSTVNGFDDLRCFQIAQQHLRMGQRRLEQHVRRWRVHR